MDAYNPFLVALSIAVAFISAYTTLDLIDRRKTAGPITVLWGMLISFVGGIGIWAMHFIGMLAYHMHFEVSYELWQVAVSAVLPMLAVAVGLLAFRKPVVSKPVIAAAGFLAGVLLIAMHVLGMLAMRMPATLSHRIPLLLLSIAIAYAVAYGPIVGYARFRRTGGFTMSHRRKLAAAFLFGIGIAAMHYTARSAAIFTPSGEPMEPSGGLYLQASVLAIVVGSFTIFILAQVLIGLFIDRHQAIKSAEYNERRYMMLFEHSPDMVVCYDPALHKLISVNPSVYRQLGYSAEELWRLPLSRLLSSREDLQRIQAGYYKVLQGLANKTEVAVRTKKGTELFLSMSLFPLYLEKRILIYLISKDMTDSKTAERELLKAKEAAEHTAAIKTQFLATMSHEIRTPLNGIIGVNQLLMESELDEDNRRLVELQEKSGTALLHILNDILDFSKLEAGKLVLLAEPFRLQDCTRDIYDMFIIAAETKGLALQFEQESDLPEHIIGDHARLRQLLLNIVGNAVKFTDHGYVRLSISVLEQSEDRVMLEFRVADTGIGLDINRIERLFQPFSQLDAALNRQHSGTGLGLAICKNLLDLMGGSIRAEARDNGGALFIFTIPYRLPQSEPDAAFPEEPPAISKMG